MDFLKKIIELKKQEIKNITDYSGSIKQKKNGRRSALLNVFKSNIDIKPVIIAEIKKASPSKGIIRPDFDFKKILNTYISSEYVDAISILTEKNYFLGSDEFIKIASKNSSKPILRKDFIIDEKQVYETVNLGADVILLIVSALYEYEFANLFKLSSELGLDVLCEIHDIKEYKLACKYNCPIIGVNNRNLKTFKVDINTTETIIKSKISDHFTVSESGISSSSDIKKLFELGVNGFLIGESIMKNPDINSALSELQIWRSKSELNKKSGVLLIADLHFNVLTIFLVVSGFSRGDFALAEANALPIAGVLFWWNAVKKIVL